MGKHAISRWVMLFSISLGLIAFSFDSAANDRCQPRRTQYSTMVTSYGGVYLIPHGSYQTVNVWVPGYWTVTYQPYTYWNGYRYVQTIVPVQVWVPGYWTTHTVWVPY